MQPPSDPNQPYYQSQPHGFDQQQPDYAGYQRMEMPKKKKKGKSGPKGAKGPNPLSGIATWLVGLGLPLMLIFFFVKKMFLDDDGGPPNPFPPKVLTKEEEKLMPVLGAEVAQELTEGRGDDCHKRVFWDAATWRVQHGMKLSRDMRPFVRDEFSKSWTTQTPGLFSIVLKGQQRVPAKFVKVRKRDGYPAVLIRIMPSPTRTLYFDLLVYPEQNGLKIIDVYDCALGTYATEVAQRQTLIEIPTDIKGRGPWLAVFGEEAKDSIIDLKNLLQQDVLGRGHQAFDTMKALPDSVRNSVQVYPMEVKALLKQFDNSPTPDQLERFRKLLETPPIVQDREITPSTLLAELHLKAQSWTDVETAFRRAYKDLGDYYLLIQLSRSKIAAGDMPGAQVAAKEVSTIAPRASELIDLKQEIEAKLAAPK